MIKGMTTAELKTIEEIIAGEIARRRIGRTVEA